MGCDIHLFVEVRDGADKPWRLQTVKWLSENDGKVEEEVGYHQRNYDVFAMLANVRNGSGFAGCDTGDGFVPISEPRGWPDDVCPELLQIRDYEYSDEKYDAIRAAHGTGWAGDHSFSYVTLAELLSYNWNKRTNKRGDVEAPGFKVFMVNGAPNSWCGGASGRSVKYVSNDDMRALVESSEIKPQAIAAWYCPTKDMFEHIEWSPRLAAFEPRAMFNEMSFYTRIQWSVSYKETARDFHKGFIPALSALGHDQNDVRIVFGFDS